MPGSLQYPNDRFALSGVSWAYYEQMLKQIGDRPLRVSYLDGKIEILPPVLQHETNKKAVGQLVQMMTYELDLPLKSFGSTTFRREELDAGVDPDECYYFHHIELVKGMKRFEAKIHPAPELAIEVDILSRSIPREPIYARLGIGEIWRYNGKKLQVRLLTPDGSYANSATIQIFPFLPMDQFAGYIPQMVDNDETRVLRSFRQWLKTLALGSGKNSPQ